MRQTELTLSNKDRRVLHECRSKGLRHAREVNRAHILAALDEKVPEALICQVLGVGRTAIWRTRAAYLEGGLDHALRDVQRPGAPRKYETDVEAELAALACSKPRQGEAWTWCCWSARPRPPGYARHQPRNDPSAAKKNCLKPWREMMWCVGVLTREYRQRMYDLLDLYARPWNANEPVVCVDEKSKQLLHDSRPSLPMVSGAPLRRDYEYVRSGTCNVFVAVEPLGGRRVTQVTDHRAKADFVAFAQHLIDTVYWSARRIHLVVDNLSTHFRSCFVETLGAQVASKLLRRVVFHYTPKHASWLNMAEIEIAALGRQCLNRRIGDPKLLAREVAAWQRRRNAERRTIQWTFTRQDADRKLGRHYVS
jgi:hypothetical protein